MIGRRIKNLMRFVWYEPYFKGTIVFVLGFFAILGVLTALGSPAFVAFDSYVASVELSLKNQPEQSSQALLRANDAVHEVINLQISRLKAISRN